VIGQSGQQFFIKPHDPDLLGDKKDEPSKHRYRKHGFADRFDYLSKKNRDKQYCRNVAELYYRVP
jgi:hypothetical protein